MMESRLMVLLVFFYSVARVTEAQLQPVTTTTSSINTTTCGTTKLCVFSTPNCNLTGNSSCFYSSAQYSNGALTVEMSGTTSGYVALALTPTTSPLNTVGTAVFVCGNNNASPFFETASQAGVVLTPAILNLINISNVQGLVTNSSSLIQCTFNVGVNTSALNVIISANVQLPSIISILTGSTNGTSLGNATTVFSSSETLDLANPASNAPWITITRVGCGTTKLCVSSTPNCNLTGNSNCFFSSVQLINQNFTFQLSGTTTGYVALGLSTVGFSAVFICGSISSNFLFTPATLLGTNLLPVNLNTVYSVQGAVSQNLVQCVFNTSSILTVQSLKSANTSYSVSIMNGSLEGSSLGTPTTVFSSNGLLDLTNPASNVVPTVLLNIDRTGCDGGKLCVGSDNTCNLTGNSSCFFGSIQLNDQTLSISLSGTTTGYVALGLATLGNTVVFVCGNNSDGVTNFFFTTATTVGSTLLPVNVSAVSNVQGVVAQNPNLVQCVFNTSSSVNITSVRGGNTFRVFLMNGTTNGNQLGSANILFDSVQALNLNSSPTITAHVFAVLLSALTLCALY
ncbi:uncharacterized protein LOC132848175 [Tachysurus vachellii]|uniref:uncharacterized protein LOC132848175 n=1 Tax=Tachysurus vachellii TaxID=175792 RepID=UPI00296AB181|nr:uncharacterized protein LOC132848175 [Tachysurus vachellii]